MKKRTFSLPGWTAPVFLLLVALLGFGLLLPNLGFYWDDWAKILVARLWGLRAYFAYYAEDRPLSAWTHILFTPLLGFSPLAWQVANLLLRWLSAWTLLWALNALWPAARRQNLTAAALYLVYPVFLQQPAGVTFFQQWLQATLYFLSLGAMIYAQSCATRRAAWLLTGLSLAGMVVQLSVTEYFAPLELLRPLILWFVVANLSPGPLAFWTRFWKTARASLPYLALISAYVLWRLFFMRLPGADPYRANTLYDFFARPLATAQKLALVIVQDLIRILVSVWSDMVNVQITGVPPFQLLAYALGVGAALLVIFCLFFYRAADSAAMDGPSSAGERTWLRQALVIALAALLLGPLPAWITGRQVVFDFHSDRYALAAMFGAGLLFTVWIHWLAQRRLQRAVLAGLLVMLAVWLHLHVANDYRWLWTSEQRFFWQLSWRAPALKAPTALFLQDEPFPNQGLFSTSAALNLMYPQPPGYGAPTNQTGAKNLAYWVYTLRPRYSHAPDTYQIALTTTFRTLRFTGQTPDSLLLYNDPSRANCLWVLSARDSLNPALPELVRTFLPISNLSRIDPAGAQSNDPPVEMIGAEPPHTAWCYFFEKADLARQQQDWPTAARLADQAQAAGYHPTTSGANSPYEWLPFIEALGHSGRWQAAADLTQQADAVDPEYRPMLCAIWVTSFQGQEQQSQGVIAQTRQSLACP